MKFDALCHSYWRAVSIEMDALKVILYPFKPIMGVPSDSVEQWEE